MKHLSSKKKEFLAVTTNNIVDKFLNVEMNYTRKKELAYNMFLGEVEKRGIMIPEYYLKRYFGNRFSKRYNKLTNCS